MADSDSDLEVIEELPVQPNRQRSFTRSAPIDNDSNDELLDLDDHDDYEWGKRSSMTKKSRRSIGKNRKTPAIKPKDIIPVGLSDDDDDKGSEATEVVRDDDDLDSLPSISPPTTPCQQTNSGAAYSHKRKGDDIEVMELDDDGLGDSYPTSYSLSGGTTNTLSKSSSRSSLYEDPGTQEIDDIFQDIEYASLADYLADMDSHKNNREAKRAEQSKPFSLKPTTSFSTAAASSSSANATSKRQPIPSFTDFARQQSNSTITKPKSSSLPEPSSSNNNDEPLESYQMNRKGASKDRKTTKAKKNTNTASSSKSALTAAKESQIPTPVQGPVKQKQPKDLLKMIVLQISESIASDELATKLIDKELQFKIIDQPEVPDSVMFEHNVPYKMVEKDLQVREKVLKEIDGNILIIFRIEQHLELLQGELNRTDASYCSEKSESLTEWIQRIQNGDPERKITLLIQGFEAYLRKLQRATQKEYRDRVLHGGENAENAKKKRKGKSQQGIKLSRFEVQNALISTQLETQMNYRFYESTAELAMFLQQYAKSVAEAPYKKEKMKSNDFDWYAVADAVGGIPVDENGEGMRSLWLAQLQQFPKVGQESAIAIARVYGSPKELFKAYNRCASVEDGKNLLTDIRVTMGVGPLAKTRKLGPEASKRIYRFFTSTDGEREIDG